MSNLSSAGNLAVSGSFSIGGNTTLNSPITSSSTASFAGISSTTLNLTNNLSQSGGSISSGSGGIASNGNFSTTGTSTLTGNVSCGSNVNVTGNTVLTGTLTPNGNVISNSQIITPTQLGYVSGATSNIQNQISAATGNITTLQTEMTANTGNITTLQTEVANNTTNISTLVGDITSFSTSITTLQTEITANAGNITTLQTDVTNNTTNISTLLGDATSFTTSIAALQSKTTGMSYSALTTTFADNVQLDSDFTIGSYLDSFTSNIHGVLNIWGDTALPTSSTGGTTGLSFYYGNNSTADVDYVAQGGSGTGHSVGSHYFYGSDTTHAPTLQAIINNNGISSTNGIDISGGNILFSSTGSFPSSGSGSVVCTKICNNNQSNNETDFINCSDTGAGGFVFYNSTTSAPTQLALLSSAGLFTNSLSLNDSGNTALSVNGQSTFTDVISCPELATYSGSTGVATTTSTVTYNNSSSNSTLSTPATVYTVTIPANYSFPITVTTPIAYEVVMGSVASGTSAGLYFASYSCTVYKQTGGVGGLTSFATPSITSNYTYTGSSGSRNITTTSTGSVSNFIQYLANLSVTFTPTSSFSGGDVYTVVYTANTPTVSGSAQIAIIYNTGTPVYLFSGTSSYTSSSNNYGMSYASFTENYTYSSIGTTVLNNVNIGGTLNFANGAPAPRYTSNWFPVSDNSYYTITHNLNMSILYPPRHILLFSNNSAPVLGTNFIANITGMCVNASGGSDGYVLDYTDANNINLSTGSGCVAHGNKQNSYTTYTTGYYCLLLFAN